MYAVVTCKKYARRSIRVVDFGDHEPEVALFGNTGECPICGPCSHVELSLPNYLTIIESFETEEDALAFTEACRAEEADTFCTY